MSAPLLDLVAVAHEAPNETKAFLESLRHIDVPYNLTVIDNASPDPRVRKIIRDGIPTPYDPSLCRSAVFIENRTNVGYARAVNQGMKLATAPFAAILNCDVEFLHRESMEKIVDYFTEHIDVGVIGPRTFDSQRKLTHAGIINTPDHPRNHHRAWQQPDAPAFQDTFECNTVSGATYFVRTSMWQGLTNCPEYQLAAPGAQGAFLPTPHFFEETFCSYHARQHGWKVIYLGSVAMIHQWHRSSPQGSKPFQEPRDMFFAACKVCGIDMAGEVE